MCGSCRPCSSPHTGQAPSFGGGIVNRPSRSSNNQPPSLLGTDRAKRKPLRPVTVFPVCQFYADRFPRDYQLPVAGLWAFALVGTAGLELGMGTLHPGISNVFTLALCDDPPVRIPFPHHVPVCRSFPAAIAIPKRYGTVCGPVSEFTAFKKCFHYSGVLWCG